MKGTNAIALLMAIAAGLSPLSAQDAPGVTLSVYAQPKAGGKNARPQQLRLVAPANMSKGVFSYLNPPEVDPLEGSTKDYKTFVILTPTDLANATRAYAEGSRLSEARRLLSAVRSKYAPFAGLPNNPATRAGMLEISCLARMKDWAGLAKLVEAFPGGAKMLDAADRPRLEAARLLSQVSDDAATAEARLQDIEALLGDSAKMSHIHSEEYSWLKYAQARALASAIPAAELQKEISADHTARASLAVDAYCESVAAAHGRYMEIPVDAMKRAFALLWAMPGVKEYAETVSTMDKKKWGAAPYNFKDAVALAYMLENIFAPGQGDAAVKQASAYFFNTLAGKKKSSQGEEKE